MSDEFLNLNFSDQEAASEAREYSALPSGKYLVRVTDLERRESTSAKHNGKPYYTLELTVEEDGTPDGQYVGQKAWWNVMMFPGALYGLSQLMKSWDLVPNRDPVPPAEEWLGKQLVMIGSQEQAKTKAEGETDKDGKQKYIPKFEEKDGRRVAVMRYEVKGAAHPNTWKGTTGTSAPKATTGPRNVFQP